MYSKVILEKRIGKKDWAGYLKLFSDNSIEICIKQERFVDVTMKLPSSLLVNSQCNGSDILSDFAYFFKEANKKFKVTLNKE